MPANGNFKIADDEALVVTLDPLGAKYVGFDLTNHWLVSLEHIRGTGSLNNEQAQRSPDGSITYVIAARDPGVYNWLSTSGFHTGNILIRWQALPESTTTADGAIQSVKVVKLNALSAALPADTQRVTCGTASLDRSAGDRLCTSLAARPHRPSPVWRHIDEALALFT